MYINGAITNIASMIKMSLVVILLTKESLPLNLSKFWYFCRKISVHYSHMGNTRLRYLIDFQGLNNLTLL